MPTASVSLSVVDCGGAGSAGSLVQPSAAGATLGEGFPEWATVVGR